MFDVVYGSWFFCLFVFHLFSPLSVLELETRTSKPETNRLQSCLLLTGIWCLMSGVRSLKCHVEPAFVGRQAQSKPRKLEVIRANS